MQPFANLRLRMGRQNRILPSGLHLGRSKAEASVLAIIISVLGKELHGKEVFGRNYILWMPKGCDLKLGR